MGFTGAKLVSSQDLRRISDTKLEGTLGEVGVTRDGRVFRYGLAGAVNLAAGKLCMIPAVVAQHQNIAVATAAVIGDMSLNLTLGSTAATASQYQDGYVIGFDASGTGNSYMIADNPVIALSTAGIFQLAEPIAAAITTSGKVNLELNPYAGALVSATSQTTEFATGVPQVAITAAYYGWFQTRGPASVLTNGSITKGSGVIPGQTTAGSVDIEGTGTITQRVGLQLQTGTTTKYSTTYLTID